MPKKCIINYVYGGESSDAAYWNTLSKTSFSLRRISQARLQAEVQAHGAGDGMERSFSAADTAGNAHRVYTVFW